MYLKDTHLIEFSAYDQGIPKICFVRFGALKDHFGANPSSAIDVLQANRSRIDPVAIRVASRTPEGEPVIIETGDF